MEDGFCCGGHGGKPGAQTQLRKFRMCGGPIEEEEARRLGPSDWLKDLPSG